MLKGLFALKKAKNHMSVKLSQKMNSFIMHHFAGHLSLLKDVTHGPANEL